MLALDYLSPLPPVRSGIADYSVDLLPHLEPLVDLRVMALPEQPISPEVEARWHPVPAERTGEGGRLPLYHMGNNRYHEPIWRLALERPGVVLLHDLVLHHFLLDRTVGAGDFEAYREAMTQEHGRIGRAAAQPIRWGAFGRAAQFFLPAHRSLLRRQRGVVVHGEWAAAVLAEEDPELAVRVVPMPIPLPAGADEAAGRAFRAAHGIPLAAPLLGSFGFQTPIKRTEVAIAALARPGLEQVHLLVAGELSPYAGYERLAEELAVRERVHVTGFLPFAELDAAIAATDLCLNLRYPSAGETSASLLRILAVGRPVVVSQYADLGDLPPDVALVIAPGEAEADELAAALDRLFHHPESLRAMGARARAHVEREHDPARAARLLVERLGELAHLAAPGDAAPREVSRTSALVADLPGAIEIGGLSGWRPGERRCLDVTVENRSDCRWLASHVLPGGVIFEVQLWSEGRDLFLGRPWLKLPEDLPPGESHRFALEIRRPIAEARLLVKPTVQWTDGHRPFASWEWDRWL
ncbi:MAG: glycosyltransferase family 4 protein [Thermoanaerobaculia bacterium]